MIQSREIQWDTQFLTGYACRINKNLKRYGDALEILNY